MAEKKKSTHESRKMEDAKKKGAFVISSKAFVRNINNKEDRAIAEAIAAAKKRGDSMATIRDLGRAGGDIVSNGRRNEELKNRQGRPRDLARRHNKVTVHDNR